ncbi:MAG: hypothetical protein VX152_12240, partial [Pseudomonadota bacterium]|nr:hypothetical protein [Pseudomonadota bacterium]
LDHSLWLHPAPDVLVLADRQAQFQLPYEATLAFNPGPFASDLAALLDMNGLNAGVMWLTRAAAPLLDAAWNLTQFITHPWWEQAALRHLLMANAVARTRVQLLRLSRLPRASVAEPLAFNGGDERDDGAFYVRLAAAADDDTDEREML